MGGGGSGGRETRSAEAKLGARRFHWASIDQRPIRRLRLAIGCVRMAPSICGSIARVIAAGSTVLLPGLMDDDEDSGCRGR